jgi:hypothetical protein
MRFPISIALGFVLLSGVGFADSISFISLTADAAAGGISNIYDSVTGLSTHGGGANQTWTFTGSASTGSLGATSGNLATTFTGFDPQNGSTANASSSASANLATGVLGISAGGFCSGTGFPANACGSASAVAEMQDGINFDNTTGQTQDVTVTWSFDGSAGTSLDHLDFLFCLAAGSVCSGEPGVPHSPNAGGYVFTFTEDCLDGNCGNPNPTSTLPTTGWVSTSVTGAGSTTETFTGIFAVPAGISSDTLNAWLEATCGDGDTCDFSHTATLSISDVNGVSFTSASGVLLTDMGTGTSPVPEPSSWMLMLTCGAGLAAAGFRRRRQN